MQYLGRLSFWATFISLYTIQLYLWPMLHCTYSVDNLHTLKSLRKLENIRLKDNTYNFTNPGWQFSGFIWINVLVFKHVLFYSYYLCIVCKNPSFRPLILEIFPNMKVLDGENSFFKFLLLFFFVFTHDLFCAWNFVLTYLLSLVSYPNLF